MYLHTDRLNGWCVHPVSGFTDVKILFRLGIDYGNKTLDIQSVTASIRSIRHVNETSE